MVVLRLVIFLLFIALLVGPGWWTLRKYLPERWQPFIRNALISMLVGFGGAILTYNIGRYFDADFLKNVSAPIFTTIFVTFLLLSIVSIWTWFWGRKIKTESTSSNFQPERRQFLERAALLGPAGALTLSPAGTAMAYNQPLVRKVSIWDPEWDSSLEGLKILQFTDVHLGLLIDVSQIKAIVDQIEPGTVDLVVLTGDIADDLSKLDPAFDVLETLKPRLGIFSSMGNHEIFRGRDEAEEVYGRRSNYLNNQGILLHFGETPIWLAGIDDPARLFRRRSVFFRESVTAAVADRPPGVAATILLSHRPDAFEAASESKVSLVLSGHTHGGQVALFGRSLFEPILPHKYLLGHYVKDNTHLYTSAGLGHWMPFRLNCPCESALITLERAS